MIDRAFAGFARQASEFITRRAALMPLGAVVLSSTMTPSPTTASKASKKAKKKVKKACKAQVTKCRSIFLEFCLGLPGPPPGCPEFMETEFGPCCDLLRTCDAAASTLCLLEKAWEEFGP